MKYFCGALCTPKFLAATFLNSSQFHLTKTVLIFIILLFVKFNLSNAAAHNRLTISGLGAKENEEHANLFGGSEIFKHHSKRSGSDGLSTGNYAMFVTNKPSAHLKRLTSSSEEITKIYSSPEAPITIDQHAKERKVESSTQEMPTKRIRNQGFHKTEITETDKLYLQDVIAARKDAIRFNIRNTSVFHIDNHNESSNENTGDSDNEDFNFVQKVVILRKPFHFHIPILTHDQLEVVAEEIQNDRQQESSAKMLNSNAVHRQTETLRDKRLKIPNTFENTNTNRKHFSPPSFGSMDYSEFGLELYKRQSRQLSADKNDYSDKVDIEYEEENDNVEDGTKFITLKRNESKLSIGFQSHFHHKNDNSNEWAHVDALLRQHPKLIPSVNRKRNSGNHVKESNYDEVWTHLPDLSEPHPDVMAIKRELKQLDFSQNLIGSILNHRDDFEEYHQKIWDFASKLGIRPLEVFHVIMQGKLDQSGMTKNHTKKVHERIYDIRSFLENTDDVNVKESPLEIHMKMNPLKRTKRGLMNWLRKVFGKTTTTTTTTTLATTSFPSSLENVENQTPILIKLKKVNKKKIAHAEESEKSEEIGDITNFHQIEENTGGYEKSIEKNTAASVNSSESYNVGLSSGESLQDRVGETEVAKKKVLQHEERKQRKPKLRFGRSASKQHSSHDAFKLTKNEMFLIQETVANLMVRFCSSMTVFTDEWFQVLKKLIEASEMPEYISAQQKPIDNVINKLVHCASTPEKMMELKRHNLRHKSKMTGAKNIQSRRGDSNELLTKFKFESFHRVIYDFAAELCPNVDREVLHELNSYFLQQTKIKTMNSELLSSLANFQYRKFSQAIGKCREEL